MLFFCCSSIRCCDSLVFCVDLIRFAIHFAFGSFSLSLCWGGGRLFRAFLVPLGKRLACAENALEICGTIIDAFESEFWLVVHSKGHGSSCSARQIVSGPENPFREPSCSPVLFSSVSFAQRIGGEKMASSQATQEFEGHRPFRLSKARPRLGALSAPPWVASGVGKVGKNEASRERILENAKVFSGYAAPSF